MIREARRILAKVEPLFSRALSDAMLAAWLTAAGEAAGKAPAANPAGAVLDAVRAAAGPHNLASLVRVREALAASGMTDRGEQDAAIQAARRAGYVGGSALEGRHGNSLEEVAAALGKGADRIGFLSVRDGAPPAQPQPPPPPPEIPDPFAAAPGEPEPPVRYPLAEAAARDLAARRVLTRADFDRLANDAKRTAFTVARVSTLDALEKIRAALEEDAAKGGTLAEFGVKVDAILADGSALSPAHVETVYRTNLGQAYRQGQLDVLQSPLVQDEFPYVAYEPVHDSRTRPNHLWFATHGLNGTNVYRADDPTIRKFWAPWDYNCRCAMVPLTLEDAARRGVQEAKKWLSTGLPPLAPSWVETPPFEPAPGFVGLPMAV